MSSTIISLIVIIIVLASIIRAKHKEAEKYRKDWEFCKKLLNKERNKGNKNKLK